MQSVNYEEGQMEALQKVFMNLNRKHYFGIKATNQKCLTDNLDHACEQRLITLVVL